MVVMPTPRSFRLDQYPQGHSSRRNIEGKLDRIRDSPLEDRQIRLPLPGGNVSAVQPPLFMFDSQVFLGVVGS
jgi:hypothetical protein